MAKKLNHLTMAYDEKNPGKYTVLSRYYRLSTGRCLFTTLAVLLLIGFSTLILYLVYRPSKPHFSIVAAAVYQLNTSSTPTNALSTTMQFSVVTRNPNEHDSILYDRLFAYVAYRNEPITSPLPLPQLFQERGSTVGMSPVLGGGFVPVSPEVTEGLNSDRVFGVVGLRFLLIGRIKYRGPFRSGWNGLEVRCDLLLGLRNGTVGQVPLLGDRKCEVDA